MHEIRTARVSPHFFPLSVLPTPRGVNVSRFNVIMLSFAMAAGDLAKKTSLAPAPLLTIRIVATMTSNCRALDS